VGRARTRVDSWTVLIGGEGEWVDGSKGSTSPGADVSISGEGWQAGIACARRNSGRVMVVSGPSPLRAKPGERPGGHRRRVYVLALVLDHEWDGWHVLDKGRHRTDVLC
jgi:hypothetical protein